MGWMACVAVIVSGVGGADTREGFCDIYLLRLSYLQVSLSVEVENIDVPTIYIVYIYN